MCAVLAAIASFQWVECIFLSLDSIRSEIVNSKSIYVIYRWMPARLREWGRRKRGSRRAIVSQIDVNRRSQKAPQDAIRAGVRLANSAHRPFGLAPAGVQAETGGASAGQAPVSRRRALQRGFRRCAQARARARAPRARAGTRAQVARGHASEFNLRVVAFSAAPILGLSVFRIGIKVILAGVRPWQQL